LENPEFPNLQSPYTGVPLSSQPTVCWTNCEIHCTFVFVYISFFLSDFIHYLYWAYLSSHGGKVWVILSWRPLRRRTVGCVFLYVFVVC